jgi:uncharacterized RDD family membrane protein YckC
VSEESRTPSGAALLGRRVAAVAVDWLMSLLVASLLQDAIPLAFGAPLVFFLQYTLFTGLFGQTTGMRLLGIAVVRVEDGRPLGLARAAVRAFLLCLFVPAVVYGDDRRGLHDKAARSVVVRV